ncbi:MAG: cellobiose transport system substrate-binding protein [Fusobacteriaceae bacterium]|jgi:ABC-type glycerol-3-phosphate transport system substrate-binding protein|nr:cellobiose transport system substrate-binding protein [Fusobacteriaceae bacterium]
MKKIFRIGLVGLLLLLTFVSAFAKQKVITVWAFSDELKAYAKDFEAANPDIKVEFTIIPNEEYPTKLRPVLRTGKGAPDIFLGEAAYVRKWVDLGMWEDLSKTFKKDIAQYKEQSPGYVVKLGEDNKGHIRAVSWQATPGGFFYRRALAKKYFGTDDPAKIEEMISTPEKFIAFGEKLRDASNGKVKLLAGYGEYENIAKARRNQGWVNSNNELVIDPALIEYMDTAKALRDKNITAKTSQWTPAWFAGFSNGEIFGYVLPTWGLHYVIKPNAGDTAGDWGVVRGPAPYYWGGTWLGIYKKSKVKKEAWEFIKMLCIDEDYQYQYTKKVGDFMSNTKVDERLANEAGDPFLAGQNHYAFFLREAKFIKGGLETSYDLDINGLWGSAVLNYVNGDMTKDEAIADFKKQVKNAFPRLTVK